MPETADEMEEGYGEVKRSSPRSFWGLRRASRDPLGAPKTAQEGAQRAARPPKMGLGGLQDGPTGLGHIPTWPERPQEWRQMLQESSKRRKWEAETAKIMEILWAFEGLWLLQFFG